MSFTLRAINYYSNQKVPGIFLQLNKKQFLINTPELIQRYLSQKSVSITQDTDIIITNSDLDYHSGLQGLMCQTAARKLQQGNRIYLPQQVYQYIQGFDYMFSKTFLNFSFCGFKDQNELKSIYGLPLQSQTSEKLTLVEFNNWDEKVQDLLKSKNKDLFNADQFVQFNSNFLTQQIIDDYQLTIISYKECEVILIPMDIEKTVFSVLLIPQQRKNFDKEKLKKFNINGSQIGQLLENKQILIDGQMFSIDYFYTQSKIPNAILIFDTQKIINQEQQQKNLQILDEIFQYQNFNLKNIVHLYNEEVFDDKLYKNYSQFFNKKDVNNIFVNKKFEEFYDHYDSPSFYLHHASQHLPYIFPEFQQKNENKSEILKQFYNNFTSYDGRTTYCLNEGIKKAQNLKIHYDENKKQQIENAFNFNNNQQLKQHRNILSQQNKFKNFPFFVFLGTGSQNPNTYRNVTSILLGINQDCYMLLDCGEGTYVQLQSQFGIKTDEIISKIKFIYLSHIHGDHTFGTFQLIAQRKQIFDKKGIKDKLIVCGPNNTRRMFESYEKYTQYKDAYYFITIEAMMKLQNIDIPIFQQYFTRSESIYCELNYWNYRYKNYHEDIQRYNQIYMNKNIQQFVQEFILENKIEQILPIPVIHCSQSSGVKLKLQDKCIIYSGDCQQSNYLSQYGQDCDLMIHESTLDCSFTPQQVIDKGHSDPSIALKIANQANAKYLALTHFSQRYKYSTKEDKCHVKLFRQDKNFKDYFKQKCFLARDHLYVDFEIIDLLCKIHNSYNKFLFLDLDQTNKQIQQI